MGKTLQALIDRAARAATMNHKAQDALNHYCERKYGCAPSDVDCDDIIDGVQGGCGASTGMSAAQFDTSMRDAIKRNAPRT